MAELPKLVTFVEINCDIGKKCPRMGKEEGKRVIQFTCRSYR